MAERSRPWKTWPRGRDLGRPGRDLRRLARGAETFEDLAERPKRPSGRDLRRLARVVETLEDLAETTETTGTWPMADPCHDDLADVNAQTKISEVNLSLRIR